MAKAMVRQIFIASQNGAKPVELREVEAVQFSGLRGDRYFKHCDTFPGNINAITLHSIEQVEACNTALGTRFAPADFRRNIITQGIDLNSLVGCEFSIGEVLLRGYELCQPCRYITELLNADLLNGLAYRGGLRAEILRGGLIKKDSEIHLCQTTESD